MSLQSMMGSLTQRFRTAPTTNLFLRAMSTAAKHDSPAMPGVLAANFQQPKELSHSLDAYSGRSIGNVSNANSAYRRLSNILYQNNVRREIRANMYYEKPTVARRRKNIERNRKLFGAMVRKKVALIMQMKQRGM